MSVVVPTFQPGPHLMETLAALENQTLPPAEILVVDDGSEPPVDIPSCRMPVRLLRIRHAGIAGARNSGVRASTAPLVHICDHDDLVEPAFLERMAMVFAAHPAVDVAHSVCGFVDLYGAVLGGQLPYRTPPTGEGSRLVARLLCENHIASVAAVFRREAFTRVGGFRPLDYVHDWDFWLRLASTGSRFEHVPETLAWHRVHPGQQSREAQRVRILDESLVMMDSLHLPLGTWLARRRARGNIHLQASRVLRARGERGALRHLMAAWHRQPIRTSRSVLSALR